MKWLIALSFVGLISLVESQYEDVRCKCVCPSVELHKVNNETHMSSRVFVHSFSEPQRCRCRNVVADEVREANPSICDHCECQWQRRNTTTIKVTVILIVCIISLLFLYMMFLLCLDPLMTRRPYMYQEHHNVEDSPSTSRQMSLEDDGATRQRPVALMTRVKHEVQKVHGEQQKWKGTVQEQRHHIYDAHTMLN